MDAFELSDCASLGNSRIRDQEFSFESAKDKHLLAEYPIADSEAINVNKAHEYLKEFIP
jgi:hypothetical protein